MNITGYKNNLRKARKMLGNELAKRKWERNPRRIKNIEKGMENLQKNIRELRRENKLKK